MMDHVVLRFLNKPVPPNAVKTKIYVIILYYIVKRYFGL